MPAGRKLHSDESFRRLHERQIHGHVGGGARMWLNVYMPILTKLKKLANTILRKLFNAVIDGIPRIIPLTDIPFGILVRKDRANNGKHLFRNIILGRNKIDLRLLAK